MSASGYAALVGALVVTLALLELARRLLTPRLRAAGARLETSYAAGRREESLGMLSETIVFGTDLPAARELVAGVLAGQRRARRLGEDRWGIRCREEDDLVLTLTLAGSRPVLGVATFAEHRGRMVGAVTWYRLVGRFGSAAKEAGVQVRQETRQHRRAEQVGDRVWLWTAE